MNQALTFESYLNNQELIKRDLAFAKVSEEDCANVLAAAEEILKSDDILQRLVNINDAFLKDNAEFTAAEKANAILPCLKRPEDYEGLTNAQAYALIFPILYNIEYAKGKYAERKIPDIILQDTLGDIQVWIDTFYDRSAKRVRGFAQMGWIREHLRLRLFKLGRLHFQIGSMHESIAFLRNNVSGEKVVIRSEDRADYPETEWTDIVKIGEPVINIHIPAGEKLDPVQCKQAIETAPQFFKKFYADQPISCAKALVTSTWLLAEEFQTLLPESSNIRGFANLFTRGAPFEEDEAFCERIFVPNGRDTKEEELTTSLQRILYPYLADNNIPYAQTGMIEIEEPKKLRIAVLGSGSGSNMQSIQDAIEAGRLNAEIVTVIADVPNAGILARAERHGLPNSYMDPAPFKTKLEGRAEDEVIRVLKEADTDVVVLAGYMRVVKPKLLAAFPNRVLNIHPALLPSFPGIAGWKQALDYGAKYAGCTVHFVNAGIDSGPIVIQRQVPVMDDDTPSTLHARIQVEEHIAYPEAIRLLSEHRLLVVGRRVITL